MKKVSITPNVPGPASNMDDQIQYSGMSGNPGSPIPNTLSTGSTKDMSDFPDDTIHYLSPISPATCRSEYEGDYKLLSPELIHFLEDFGVPEYSPTESSLISCIEPELQRTLAIVRPEAMEYKDAILRAVTEAGFSFVQARTVHLSPEQVSEIYSAYYGSMSFPHLVVSISIGPILVLSLGAINAIAKWKELIGPDKTLHAEWFYPMSVRVRFGLHKSIQNALHASQHLPNANKENRYFFPESILEPLISTEDRVKDYCNLYINSTLLNGLVEVVRVKPVDPILHLAEWLLKNNPYQPNYPPEIAILKT